MPPLQEQQYLVCPLSKQLGRLFTFMLFGRELNRWNPLAALLELSWLRETPLIASAREIRSCRNRRSGFCAGCPSRAGAARASEWRWRPDFPATLCKLPHRLIRLSRAGPGFAKESNPPSHHREPRHRSHACTRLSHEWCGAARGSRVRCRKSDRR